MNSHLLFDFSVNKENNTISVRRAFAANLEIVWAAWTTPEILDQWWAPEPWKTRTKSMDFREGGRWIYAMVGPDHSEHWNIADYKEIIPLKSFSGLDAFCDEEGTVNKEFPHCFWKNSFSEAQEITTVDITIQYEQLADLEKIIQMGFKEGFTMALGNLDRYIAAVKKNPLKD